MITRKNGKKCVVLWSANAQISKPDSGYMPGASETSYTEHDGRSTDRKPSETSLNHNQGITMTIAFDNNSSFIAISSGNTYLGQGGEDTYFLSDNLIAANSQTVISDNGSNIIQLSGLSIVS